MCYRVLTIILAAIIGLAPFREGRRAEAGRLTVDLGRSQGVVSVGALMRWDKSGDAVKQVNKDAKIDQPEVAATAKNLGGGKWVFGDLKPGRYDLVIMLQNKTRIEGFGYPPVLDFDPFFPPDASVDEDIRAFIDGDIRKSEHYENKVEPLYMGTNKEKKAVRVLVQLLRDKATTYKAGAGTMRHEIWQYDWLYGGWKKTQRTRVLDRIIMQVSDLRQWHWLWDPKLGDIQIGADAVEVKYSVPEKPDPAQLKGLYPY